ncbi:MAG: HAD family hydrolase [Selenomonadaceae bacterium]|nr:HAD family hydrolase [Selenomonadaceae bacterium]
MNSIIKFAASDFDGTLFRNQNISAEDLKAVSDWRAAGNVFGMVTGRPYIMLISYFKHFGVEVDFAICCNGSIIHDGKGEVIFEKGLPIKTLLEIMKEPVISKTHHFAFETADNFYCLLNSDKSWAVTMKDKWDFPLTMIDAAQVTAIPKKINQLALCFDTIEETKAAEVVINEKYGDEIFAQRNTISLDIVPVGINKSSGVAKMLELKNWRDAQVSVIGDESNDLPMIKTFGGFTVATAKDFVKQEAAAIFDSVGAMLMSRMNS